ncbi:MAG: NAD(P)/FAD-dependent oxidoreductase [Vicinamibacterales bacterium]
MEHSDVLIVGGGPAGSACAWRLRQEGLDVIVIDRAQFPRDKLCAGWITPQAVATLSLSTEEYAEARILQPITGFRTSLVGEPPVITRYPVVVSYAIRRCEFDTYLLYRSGATLRLGTAVKAIESDGKGRWVVNGSVAAHVLVGAGGHFCPVARLLHTRRSTEPAIVAREVEFEMDEAQQAACLVQGDTPELYLAPDLAGYGWLVRKGNFLNVGFGQIGGRGFAGSLDRFVSWIRTIGRLPPGMPAAWPGHAYLVWERSPRQPAGDGVLLVGDALGVAAGASGEGIRPAIESGILAAETLIEARGIYTRDRLERYSAKLSKRFGPRSAARLTAGVVASMNRALARPLLRSAWFTRTFVLDRWFLQREVPAL